MAPTMLTRLTSSLDCSQCGDIQEDAKTCAPRSCFHSPWTTLISDIYDMRWKMIIRPPRDSYTQTDLGPALFTVGEKNFERQDVQLTNDRGQRLECSHFVPSASWGSESAEEETQRLPCVIYLHGMCSSRMEVFDILFLLLDRNMSVFCLDFAGCGWSEGEYISLGHFEEQDLQVVIQYLRRCGVGDIGLWGRSMGASTAVMRAASDPTLSACVLDSGFASLTMAAREVVRSMPLRMQVPECILDMALRNVRREVKSRANFDIEDLQPIRQAPHARVPALFAVATEDEVVPPHHTKDLYDAWGGEKTLVTLGGGHNTPRSLKYLTYAANFLRKRLVDEPGCRAEEDRPPMSVPWTGKLRNGLIRL